jgi:predicted amidohydrolase YtcJ
VGDGKFWLKSCLLQSLPPRFLDEPIHKFLRVVLLVSYDGHSFWVNSTTLDRAQINKDTPNSEGGLIEHDPTFCQLIE